MRGRNYNVSSTMPRMRRFREVSQQIRSCPQTGFAEISSNVLEADFWTVNVAVGGFECYGDASTLEAL